MTLSPRRYWRRIAPAVAIVLVTLLVGRMVISAYSIGSRSMGQTLLPGDHVLVNNIAYGIRNPLTGSTLWQRRIPDRGDVVTYRYPPDKKRVFTHRAVGLPGEMVEVRGGRAFVNSTPLDEPYLVLSGTEEETRFLRDFGPVQVPDGHVFLLGDSRFRSMDSRATGFIPLEDVFGRVQLIYWSWDSEARAPRWSRVGLAVH